MPEPSGSESPASVVAVHQPNYSPWLGYFHKIACADHFVFLDNVQFSRLNYTNRVKIAGDGPARWLTQPVRRRFGQPICDVQFADARWPIRHLDALRGAYGRAASFRDVWDDVVSIYETIPPGGLAVANQFLIESLVRRLGLACAFLPVPPTIQSAKCAPMIESSRSLACGGSGGGLSLRKGRREVSGSGEIRCGGRAAPLCLVRASRLFAGQRRLPSRAEHSRCCVPSRMGGCAFVDRRSAGKRRRFRVMS